MKLTSIVIGVIGVLFARGEPQEVPEPRDVQPVLVYDLTKSNDWEDAMSWGRNMSDLPLPLRRAAEADETGEQVQKHWLVTFYAPWCGHCKRMIPNMLDASHHFQNWQQKSLVRFGRVDCTVAKKRCANYGVYSYPTILWLNGKGDLLAEFPAGPRSSEAILSFVAAELRPKVPMPMTDEDFDTWQKSVQMVCRQDVNMAPTKTYHMSLCKSNLMHNTILGDESSIEKLERLVPDINEKHMVLKIPEGGLIERFYPESKRVCWLDNIRPRMRHCVNVETPEGEMALIKVAKKYAHPMIFTEATWEDFFQARRQTPKMTVLMVGSRTHVSDYAEWMEEYEKIRDDDLRESAIFLEAKVAAPLAKIFEQVGAGDQPLPWVGVWMGPLEKQEFFLFDGVKEDMFEWILKVRRGEIQPFYRSSKGLWQKTKEDFIVFGRILRRAYRNSPWHQKALIALAIAVIVGGIGAINYFIPSDEEEAVRAAETILLQKAKERAAAAADDTTKAGDDDETESVDDTSKSRQTQQTVRQRK